MDKPQPTPLLSAAEERSLARAIEAGVLAGHLLDTGERPVTASVGELEALAELGRLAWQRFLLANVGLVGKLAGREARRTGLPADDLFQEGFVALAGALQRYDPDKGRFSTFAVIRIRQRLAEVGAGRLGELALPASRAMRLRRARGLEAVLGQELGHDVATSELAAELGRPAEWTRRLLGYRAPVPVGSEALALPDPEPADPLAAIYAGQLRRVVNQLAAEQASVLRLRFGLATGEPVEAGEVAAWLGVSLSTVRRLERRGLEALRAVADRLDPSADGPLAG